jgi:hypothetical protein
MRKLEEEIERLRGESTKMKERLEKLEARSTGDGGPRAVRDRAGPPRRPRPRVRRPPKPPRPPRRR